MSILAKKLADINRTSGPEIGFRRSSGQQNRRQMLIIADISGQDKNKSKSVAASGVDALLSDIPLLEDSSGEKAATLHNVPVGILIDNTERKEKAVKKGIKCDYTVFSIDMPVEMLESDETGKVLIVESDLSPQMIRIINNLSIPVDAVLLADHGQLLTFKRLLTCQLFTELLQKPLLVTVPSTISSSELSSLCQAGVRGVVIAAGAPAKAYTDIVKIVENLPRIKRQKTKGDALLPSVTSGNNDFEEEEEEDI